MDAEIRDVTAGGLRGRLQQVIVTTTRATAAGVVEAVDEAVLAIELGDPRPPSLSDGPGPARLWREWERPPAGPATTVARAARRAGTAEVGVPEPGMPPGGWWVRDLPGGDRLPSRTYSYEGGVVRGRPEWRYAVEFGVPAGEHTALEFDLVQLWAFRFVGSQVTVPAPRPDEPTALGGAVISGGGCTIELIEWAPTEQGLRLVARCESADVWPELRVMVGDVGASMSGSISTSGTLRAGLPMIYRDLLDDATTMDIALRTVAHRVPMRFIVDPGRPTG